MRTCTRALSDARPHSKNSWWLYLCVCVCVSAWLFVCVGGGGGAFKCACSSAVLSISQGCLSLKIKPARWSGGKTQENQSYNYPDFLCHLKQRRTPSRTAVLACGRASVTVLIIANFVIGSMALSILPADSRVFCVESARPRKSHKEISECNSHEEIIAEKLQTSLVLHGLLHNPSASLFRLRAPSYQCVFFLISFFLLFFKIHQSLSKYT